MGRLFLVIGDTDTAYLDGLLKYLSYAYSDRFRISSFTSTESLMRFLSGHGGEIDILLVAPEIYSDKLPENRIKTLIILSSGRLHEDINSHGVVNKYQHGDRIATEVIGIYSRTNKKEIISVDGGKKTRVVSVYSPAGGTGKTTIAIGTSVICAQAGKKVLYIGFEDISTLPMFFQHTRSPNLSNIIYYLKDKEKNLAFKIEGIRCIDSGTGLHFFAPPDCAWELDELSSEDVSDLISHIRSMHYYDVVFIDMPCTFSRRNLSLMLSSDDVFLVTTRDETSCLKLVTYENQLSVLSDDERSSICGKTVLIVNNGIRDVCGSGKSIVFGGRNASLTIPAAKGKITVDRFKNGPADDDHFYQSMVQLASRLL